MSTHKPAEIIRLIFDNYKEEGSERKTFLALLMMCDEAYNSGYLAHQYGMPNEVLANPSVVSVQ